MSRSRPSIAALVLFVPFLAFESAHAANTYVWTGATNTTWTVSSNWTPTRSIPATDDILRFESGTFNVTGVPSTVIGQLVLDQANVTLTPSIQGAKVIQMSGGAGVDLDVSAGSSISISGLLGLSIILNAGTTGTIAGQIELNDGPHRLIATDPGGLVVAAGGVVRTLSAYPGAVFGQTSLNSVVFQAGSTYEHGGGSSVFGATQPNAVVAFQPGSLYRQMTTDAPPMSGRTYGNYEYNGGFTATTMGSFPLTIDSITVNSGRLHIALPSAVSIRGAIRVAHDAQLLLGPTTGNATYALNGSAPQRVQLDHNDFPGFEPISFDGTPGLKLRIDNPLDVWSTAWSPVLSCSLEFVHGRIVLAEFPNRPFGIQGNGTIIGASASTGWIVGNMNAYVRPTAHERLFPIGDLDRYAPIHLDFLGLGDSLLLRVTTLSQIAPHTYPYFFMAGIDSTQKVDRGWVVSENAVPGAVPYTSFDAALEWSPLDVDPGADTDAFVLRALAYYLTPFGGIPYHDVSVYGRSPTSIGGTDIQRWHSPLDGTYYLNVGEPAVLHLAVRSVEDFEGNPGGGASTLVIPVSLSPAPVTTTTVQFETTDGTATLADSDYTAASGTLTFTPGDTVKYVSVLLGKDTTPERNETFGIVLSNPVGAEIAAGSAIGTILDDDDVTDPTVTVIAPNGGQSYVVGTVVPLQWSATDDVAVARVDLRIKRGSSPVEVVALDVPNTGSYAWTATMPIVTTARLLVSAVDDRGNQDSDLSDADWTIADPVGVEPIAAAAFALGRPAPNPASARAGVSTEFTLPHEARVDVAVLDVRGRRVATLETGVRPAGVHRATWKSDGVAPGLYFVRFVAPGFEAVRRVVVTSSL